MNVRHAIFLVLALSACPRKSEPPAAPPSPPPASGPATLALPVLEGTCASDDDCTYSFTYLVDGKCCNGTCTPSPASKADLTNVERVCATLGFAEQNCPAKKCVAPPKLKCVAGHCAAVPN